ncbi:MAG: 50S ribosomal protein L3 [Phycisphaerae bacterium]|nr:50S ribosomal protein L3 [Phycisphaerae bacterium]
MVPAILGKKIGMTQVFDPSGERVPVTIVQAGPCVVLQTKQADGKDGYNSVQLGFDDVKPHRSTMPEIGHARKAQTAPKRFVREIRLAEPPDKQIGETVTVELFEQGGVKYVDVIGTTKGKGFQGGMGRWGFGGQPASHGTERKHRSPGSIGGRGATRGHSGAIKKGKRMAGHTGNQRRTIRNQPLVSIDAEHNLLVIRGAIPGAKGSYVIVRKAKTRE